MKKFLFATDFSQASMNAFRYSKELVKGTRILIDCIHVYDIPIAYSTQTPSRAVQGQLKELKKATSNRIDAMLVQLPNENRGKNLPVYGLYPSMEIEEMARTENSDLIIMALREDYGLLHRFIGNTTAKTIHKSEIPVLAIPFNAQYEPIRRILFPTSFARHNQLSAPETKAIRWLSDFSGFLNNPEIELLHIIEDRSLDTIDISFLNNTPTSLKLTHSHALTVEEGILEYMHKRKPHLLAFYKQHRSFWERLYRPSKTRQLLYDSNIPLIVFG